MGLIFTWGLDDDKEIILIGGDHHLVLFASDTQESEVIGGVKITYEISCLSR